jgi:hypothetical protein
VNVIVTKVEDDGTDIIELQVQYIFYVEELDK